MRQILFIVASVLSVGDDFWTTKDTRVKEPWNLPLWFRKLLKPDNVQKSHMRGWRSQEALSIHSLKLYVNLGFCWRTKNVEDVLAMGYILRRGAELKAGKLKVQKHVIPLTSHIELQSLLTCLPSFVLLWHYFLPTTFPYFGIVMYILCHFSLEVHNFLSIFFFFFLSFFIWDYN